MPDHMALQPVETTLTGPSGLALFTRSTLLGQVSLLLADRIGFAAGFCVLGAWLPARRAARMDPAAVLTGR